MSYSNLLKNTLLFLLLITFNQIVSQNISNKTIDGSWEVVETNINSKVFNFSQGKSDSISAFFKTARFVFNKKGLVIIQTEKSIQKPFNNNLFNTVLYFNVDNNIISIGNRKKSSNILYVQANQKSDVLFFNINGALLKLIKTGDSSKLKINKKDLLSTQTLLSNKPFINEDFNENEVFSDEVDEFSKTYNCQLIKDKNALKKCVSQTVMGFFMRKFNPEISANLGLSGLFKNKIEFIINTEGNVVNIHVESKNEALSHEIKRTVNLLPRFIPAYKNGEPVNSKYSFPFVFRVQD